MRYKHLHICFRCSTLLKTQNMASLQFNSTTWLIPFPPRSKHKNAITHTQLSYWSDNLLRWQPIHFCLQVPADFWTSFAIELPTHNTCFQLTDETEFWLLKIWKFMFLHYVHSVMPLWSWSSVLNFQCLITCVFKLNQIPSKLL